MYVWMHANLFVNVFLPLLHGVECVDARDVKHNECPHCLLVVHTRHVAKPLLAYMCARTMSHSELKA